MSIVEERRRENWRGVRRGVKVLVEGSWEGKMEMWRGLFWGGVSFSFGLCVWLFWERGWDGMGWNGEGHTLRPMTPRQAMEGMAMVMVMVVGMGFLERMARD